MEEYLQKAKENMIAKESILSKYACKSKDAILLKEDNDEDIRPPFFRENYTFFSIYKIYR